MIGPALLFLLAAAPASLPSTAETLARAAKAAEKFWDQFSAVTCTEAVTQARLNQHGKPSYEVESAYDYLIMLQISGADFVVEESRVPVKAARDTRTAPLLVTNGFSTLMLIFHPFFQGGYEYGNPEPERLDGRDVLRIRFQQAKGGRSPSVLKLRQREYPLEWSGSAWLDAASGAIVRIEAGLKAGMEDIGLRRSMRRWTTRPCISPKTQRSLAACGGARGSGNHAPALAQRAPVLQLQTFFGERHRAGGSSRQ